MNKQRIGYSVAAILIVIGVVFAVMPHDRKAVATKASPVSTTPAAVVSPGFYLSSVYDIYFTYPTKYVLDEKDVNIGKEKRHTLTLITASDRQLLSLMSQPSGIVPSDAAPAAITVDIFQGAAISQTPDQWVKSNAHSNFALSQDKHLAPTTISGLPAVAYSWNGALPSNSVVFAYKGNIIMLSMSYVSPQDVVWKDFSTVFQSFKVK